MKKHSRILLLALAGTAVFESGLSMALTLHLPIGQTASGKRSLVYFLAREKQIWLERHQGILRMGLTTLGRRRLQAQFPALKVREAATEPSWQLLLLKQAPISDPHFRSLAVLCKKFRVLRLARGVYAYPGSVPQQLETQLDALYDEDNLARCTVNEWVSGLDRPVIVSYYDIENLSAIYSSISNEIDRLPTAFSSDIETIYRTISSICSIIDRLESALSGDSGLVSRYFPKTPFPSDLVNRLADCVSSIQLPE